MYWLQHDDLIILIFICISHCLTFRKLLHNASFIYEIPWFFGLFYHSSYLLLSQHKIIRPCSLINLLIFCLLCFFIPALFLFCLIFFLYHFRFRFLVLHLFFFLILFSYFTFSTLRFYTSYSPFFSTSFFSILTHSVTGTF